MKGNLFRSYWHEILANSVARLINLGASALALVIIVRSLDLEAQGAYAAVTVWSLSLATTAGLSLGSVCHYRIHARATNSWDGTLFGSLIAVLTIVTLIVWGFTAITYHWTNGRLFGNLPAIPFALALASLPLLIWEEYSINLIAAAGKIRTFNHVQIIGRLIGLASLIFFLHAFHAGIYGAISAGIVSQIITAAGSFWILWRLNSGRFQVDFEETAQLAKGGLRLHANTIGTLLLFSSSLLVLNHLATRTEVGWYNVAWQIVAMLTIVPQAATAIIYSILAEQGPNQGWPAQKRIMTGVMLVVAVIITCALVAGPWLIVAIAGEQFRTAGSIVQILALALPGISLSQLMAPQWISRGIFVPTSIITIATGALQLIISAILIELKGVFGAAWATAITLGMLPLFIQGYFAWWCEKTYRHSLTAN